MTEQQYREAAQRRARQIWIAAGILIAAACAAGSSYNVLYDNCTESFDRAPEAVVEAYVNAIRAGDGEAAQRCWDHQAYYDLSAGCSEICLSRILGTDYTLQNIRIVDDLPGDAGPEIGRERIFLNIWVACGPTGETRSSSLTVDSVSMAFPWRHWKIIESDFGGPLAEPWCQ